MHLIWAAAGAAVWLVAQVIALGVAGAGHGWTGPLYFTLPLALLYPAAFLRRFAWKTAPRAFDLGVVGIAIVLDALLVINIWAELGYIPLMWRDAAAFVAAWFVLWAGWQGLVIRAALGGRFSER